MPVILQTSQLEDKQQHASTARMLPQLPVHPSRPASEGPQNPTSQPPHLGVLLCQLLLHLALHIQQLKLLAAEAAASRLSSFNTPEGNMNYRPCSISPSDNSSDINSSDKHKHSGGAPLTAVPVQLAVPAVPHSGRACRCWPPGLQAVAKLFGKESAEIQQEVAAKKEDPELSLICINNSHPYTINSLAVVGDPLRSRQLPEVLQLLPRTMCVAEPLPLDAQLHHVPVQLPATSHCSPLNLPAVGCQPT